MGTPSDGDHLIEDARLLLERAERYFRATELEMQVAWTSAASPPEAPEDPQLLASELRRVAERAFEWRPQRPAGANGLAARQST